ncbi:DUF3710 domain-containing protein [Solicola gregarius]|uniref:DUF3710 domain-containing protein n=1 Tax=Solicola gregarius TaxID=2908642 RepID=A0AA46YMC2_9ACTN|nr:DUF3710 domain-containing protein [Solicola gregarius]UYM07935.1 DUF3710 domain-containing protein [Solicola gregarius]
MRRKSKADPDREEASAGSETAEADRLEAASEGPWDVDEISIASDDGSYVDLGGLIVKGREGFEVQIPSDPKSGQPAAVVFVSPEAALELRAFAAKRSGGLWEDVRSDIAGEAARLKGECEVVDGRHGPELRLQVPAKSAEGGEAVQPSRIVGVEGPRWFLRGTFYGKAAMQPDDDGVLESAFRDVVVRRGEGPMAPREALPIVIPENATPKEQ